MSSASAMNGRAQSKYKDVIEQRDSRSVIKSMNDRNQQIRISGRLLRIACMDAELYHFLSNPEPLIDQLRASDDRIDLFTFMQGLPEGKPRFSYPMDWDNLAVVHISTFENWWTKQIGGKTRNMVKQAMKKGVEVREVEFDEELVRGIWEIYNECPMRQGRRFPHYGKDFDAVYRDEATYLDSSTFLGAYHGEELIGFIKMVTDISGVQTGLMNILSKVGHRDKSPTNALIAQAVKSCAERGIDHLVYANFAYGNKQHDSLREFKERNGFKRVDVPRYFVPLTLFGGLALRMGFHHRLFDRIPIPLAEGLRKLRKHTYAIKAQTLKESH